ncbi:PH domain-containing protein [Chryseobacterium echinoideorum]|uniref:PH domain-containing protein n=1 Tax=Chryseobacterium echinoideorum TaxID=1549648 RepID=UPI0016285DF8|nr:PH domain-containing protein [Chryseobacterium echinoideorum]
MEEKYNSFFTPQRQSKIGIALLFLYSTGEVIKNSWIFIFLFFFRDKKFDLWIIFLIVSAVFFILSTSAVLQYYNFRYYIDAKNEEFIIHKGIINKSSTKIKIRNIQEVNISQSFVHRLFNIFKLEVDSPGSSEKEVSISALSRQNAYDLKKYLLEEKNIEIENGHIAPDDTAEISTKKQLSISNLSILKYGLTANYVQSFFALISLVIYGITQLNDLLKKAELDAHIDYDEIEKNVLSYSFPILLGIILLVLILGVIVNSVRAIIRYFNFKVEENYRNFSFEYGLFSTKNAIVTKSKVQVVTEIQNWVQKKMNVSLVKFLQIGKSENEKNVSSVLGISQKEKEHLICSIWGDIPKFNNVLKPNYRMLIVNHLIWIVFPFLIVFFIDKSIVINYWEAAIMIFIIIEIIIIFSYLNLRLFYNENFIRLRSGFWDVHYRTFEIDKIQTVKISQYFWQKKSNLGSITFYTSAGKFGISVLNFSEVKKLFNNIIYKIETSKKS